MKLSPSFFLSPTGQGIVVGLIAALVIGGVAWRRSQVKPEPKKSETISPAALPKIFQRPVAKVEPTSSVTPPPMPVPVIVPERPKVLPLSVVAGASRKSPFPSAPYGRLIPCETVVTLESSRIDTPIIGLVTEDVWHNGVLIVPAGAEVHGRASVDRVRERLAAQGTWRLVWRVPQRQASVELRVEGLALDRERDPQTGRWGDHDGSAGLRGLLVRTDDWRELKFFASTFLSTATLALQETRSGVGLLGESSVALATGKNAALAGTSSVLREYAQHLKDTIQRDGFYLRIPAGKLFYLYLTEPIAPPRDRNASEPPTPLP